MATTAFYNCESLSIKTYVGVYPVGPWEVFDFDHVPAYKDRLPYIAIIGPFRTKRAAHYMADHGRNNPHLQTVADAEKLSKEASV